MTTGRFSGHWLSEREARLGVGFSFSVVVAVHDRQISEHGGPDGIRDDGAIESALARPLNMAACGDPGAASLTAAYAYGIAMNHGFADGNKRTAWVIARLFLADNGYGLDFDPMDAVHTMEGVAAGRVDEDELAAWLRVRMSRSAAAG